MNSKLDIARYHKPLSVGIFGGGTLALLLATMVSFMNGSTGLGILLGIVFLLVGIPAAFYFIDLFIWEPRRAAKVAGERMGQFNTTQRHQRDRVRQREKGLRG
jgi:hypothetical protein